MRPTLGAILYLSAAALSTRPVAAVDPWTQLVGNGFGDNSNEGVGWVQSFNGFSYVALDRSTGSTGGALLYRSSDLTNWTKVVGPGTGTVLSNSITQIIRMTANGTNDLYFGTISPSVPVPAQVYHSTNGSSWTQIATVANGYAPSGNSSIGGLAVQGPNLFTATVNTNGAQIWKSRLDGAGYTKVADFNTGLHLSTGVNKNINFVSYLYAASNGMLYASTSHLVNGAPAAPQNGFLYQSSDAGASWTQNTGVGNGFGDPNNWHIACLLEYRGFLYATLNNSAQGGQLWRTADGTSWTKILSGGINDARNVELHHLSVSSGLLWVATLPQPGFADEVWRSSDGTNFTMSNLLGFGDPNNSSRFPSVGGLGTDILFGCRNTVTGAQVWRLGPLIDTPSLQGWLATNRLHLAWPAMAVGFNLETTTNLQPPRTWTQPTNTITVVGSQNTSVLAPSAAGQFYRLHRP